jgi:acyl-homoserine lactone acylase PvdQ
LATMRLCTATAALVLLALLYAPAAAMAAAPGDFAGDAFNILPPGQDGALFKSPNSTDQIPLYNGLTPKFDDVTAADLPKFFKPNVFGLAGQAPARVESPPQRPGLHIDRDSFDVPHVYGDSRDDVVFGAGWVAYEDRGFLMDLLRGPGRIAALDVPGINAFSLLFSFRMFTPTAATEQFLDKQVNLIEAHGTAGARVIADIDSYVAGINAYQTASGASSAPWTRHDVLAVAALIGAVFGHGGGDEVRRAELLNALQQRLGSGLGLQVWNDLREAQDPETLTSFDQRFPYGGPAKQEKGNAVVDDGSFEAVSSSGPVTPTAPSAMSNALLIGASRSTNGHPLFVAGPQVGYFYPEALMEMDLHGGGIDARGVVFPGSGPYVEIGRGKDYAWSATSSGSDIIDQYVEKLCGDDTHYVFDHKCRAMTTFDAGVLANPAEGISFHETVHGPVIGYATVKGERVAISQKRSTRGREAASALGFADLNTNAVDSPQSFFDAANKIEFTFNWVYADDRHIAMFSSGLLPVRPKHLDTGLPALGTGKYEWEGFLPQDGHAHGVDPASGEIVNWNNKPARGFSAADDQWSYGPAHRVNLLDDAVNRSDRHTLASLVAAMNRAATQDLRNTRVLPSIAAVLDGGAAPNARDAQMLELLKQWRANGSSRLDVDQNGRIDDPGAAVMDTAWPKIADAVMSPVLGPQLDQLASVVTRDQSPSSQGSAYQSGWYGYVDKDLRTVAGLPVRGAFKTRFCGQGDLAACRAALWAAIDAAGSELEAAQGPDPSAWSANSGGERIRFQPTLLLPDSMRWTNRPTFQQAISFSGHR